MAEAQVAWKGKLICCATEPFIFLIMVSLGSHYSVTPQLLIHKLCLQRYNSSVCHNLGSGKLADEEALVNEEAAKWNLYIFLAISLPSIFTSAIMGYLYDVVLKARVILLFPLAMALQSIIYLISAQNEYLHVGFLVVGASATSLCGDIQGSILVAYAYMADITNTSERRTLRMALTESSVFAGQAVGGLISGLLLHNYGFQSVYWTTLSVNIINFVYIVVMLPIGRKPDPEEESDAPRVGVCSFLSNCTRKERITLLLPLLVSVAFTNMAVLGENEILPLYLKHQPLNLLPREIGMYTALLHLGRGAGAAFNSVILMKLVKPSDYMVAIIGLVSLIATHVAISLIHSKPALYGSSCLSLTAPLAMSAFRSIATKAVGEEEHGMVLSLIAVVSMIGLTVVTVSANSIYRTTARRSPGLAFLLLACFSGSALIITILLYMRNRLMAYIRDAARGKNAAAADEELVAAEETTPFLEGELRCK